LIIELTKWAADMTDRILCFVEDVLAHPIQKRLPQGRYFDGNSARAAIARDAIPLPTDRRWRWSAGMGEPLSR
jgi:hypothetical protein